MSAAFYEAHAPHDAQPFVTGHWYGPTATQHRPALSGDTAVFCPGCAQRLLVRDDCGASRITVRCPMLGCAPENQPKDVRPEYPETVGRHCGQVFTVRLRAR